MKRLFCIASIMALAAFCSFAGEPSEEAAGESTVESLKITILSTNLANRGLGEWGFSALVEADGKAILFDTGNRKKTVLDNAEELEIDLTGVEDVVLSHNHGDHVGGLVTLRKAFRDAHPKALSRAHIVPGFFPEGLEESDEGRVKWLAALKKHYEAAGGTFVEHEKPFEILPGVWLSGFVPRLESPESRDVPVPDDQSLFFSTKEGTVILCGCCHAGVINTVEHARKLLPGRPIHALLGGLHLMRTDEAVLASIGRTLKEAGIRYLWGAHCTGTEAHFVLRDAAGLSRSNSAVGAVGGTFTLGEGIAPGSIAH